jgi:hypothetical protein
VNPAENVDVLHVTDDCRLFAFGGTNIGLPAALYEIRDQFLAIDDQLSPEARAAASIGMHGVLFGLAHTELLIVFVIGGADLVTGATCLVESLIDNVPDGATAPALYWLSDGGLDEIAYELDANAEVDSIELPDALMALAD